MRTEMGEEMMCGWDKGGLTAGEETDGEPFK